MKQEKWYKILGYYLRQHVFSTVVFLGFIGIFAMVFRLYDLEVEAVWYAAGLCILFALSVLAVHFVFYWKEHRQRMRILKNVSLLADELPEPRTLVEKDLQEMIGELNRMLEESETGRQTDRRESMDYYTTWVHQVKTPIAAMKMILESEDTEEYRELRGELFRIEQYVEMVLSYLRLGSDTSDYVFKEYELDSIIRQAIRKYAPQFIRRKIQLKYEGTDLSVLTDEKWLLFIIEQMLSNSIKYTPHGAVTITVTGEKILKIADTGIGIAPEDIPRIFEKGFTGYNGRMGRKSTGLGLYLCRTAADRLSHKIQVESVPGKGTVFSIDLRTGELLV
ncbi:MAG: HAMP domain-containing histidine kinase [Clostridiales bacterium]|nr:HAMP domain-containing histidine kinase [Clostridiales bacterium]